MNKLLHKVICDWCIQEGWPEPEPEHRFHPTRKWRLDFAWLDEQIAIEVDGGLFKQGRHSRGAGREADMVKLNEALLLGWRVLSVSTRMVDDGRMLAWLERLLSSKSTNRGR